MHRQRGIYPGARKRPHFRVAILRMAFAGLAFAWAVNGVWHVDTHGVHFHLHCSALGSGRWPAGLIIFSHALPAKPRGKSRAASQGWRE
jgi:hypothetical protein